MSNFFEELKTRNVYKVATAYTVTAWLLMQVVGTLANNLRWPASIAETFTLILIAGFPIALILTWLYEFTPKGIKRTGKIQQDTFDNRKAGRRLNRVIIGTLAITLCFMLVERFFFAGRTTINKKQKASIAVLPFVNMSSDAENAYFADGLTESILDKLAKISGMQVTARTSSFKFKDKNEDVRDIGQQLSVNYILEGSVQYDRRSNRIRITAQLINANNGYHLSSDSYEDNFDEIFRLQEDVSRKIASKLQVRLLPQEERELASELTGNKDAYKLYLEARTYSVKRDDKNLEKAINLLNQALEIDPEFAEAHAELSFLYPQRFFYGNLSKEVRDEKMDFHLREAVRLAPNKAEVLLAEARYNSRGRWDSSLVISKTRKAIELQPSNADAHFLLFQALGRAGQMELRIASLDKAVTLDPFNSTFLSAWARLYFYQLKQPEKGLQAMNKVIANDSSYLLAAVGKMNMLTYEPYGDLAQAFTSYHQITQKNPYERPNPLLVTSLDLDLDPVSDKYARYQQMNYPDNEDHTFGNILFLHSLKKEYELARDWILFWEKEKNLDPELAALHLAYLEWKKGDHSGLYALLDKWNPKFRDASITSSDLDGDSARDLIDYINILRMTNDKSLADNLAAILCEYYQNRIDDNPYLISIGKERMLMDCYYASDDIQNFLDVLNTSYFVHKNKDGVFSELRYGTYDRFNQNAEFRALKNRIIEDTHRMRAEVITYLKEEGEWDPDWDKELGLD
ncbi:hypothetical protein [Muriicola soli]|uniref:Uncharacterized protein n=1 Tax=Muriicola soli TaxID=2507538 RepID=A0A411E825_9FLAO|nr:hypothetical protein [Muriicola soli]QBA63832.1 hypothetical protein EQY75_04350 [Muriicola soli]